MIEAGGVGVDRKALGGFGRGAFGPTDGPRDIDGGDWRLARRRDRRIGALGFRVG